METTHSLHVRDSRDLSIIADDSVDLVVTSPPYPMIDIWDEMFADLDPAIGRALQNGDGRTAFDRMHDVLSGVWDELQRILVPGGVACINIGDATRRVDDHFEKYANAARINRDLVDRGFTALPDILWHKPSNSAAKFMGSGMLPPNAYVTLEHEFILLFRNGTIRRSFEPGADRRYKAAYFWEERNRWFTDLWTDIRGTDQSLADAGERSRSAAFPLEIPFRLITMYSAYGDTVLDPFCGTGTTTMAAMVGARNSIGVDADGELIEGFDSRVDRAPQLAHTRGIDRLKSHEQFVAEHRAAGGDFQYAMEHYDLPVKTKQERRIRLYEIADVSATANEYRVDHVSIDEPPNPQDD